MMFSLLVLLGAAFGVAQASAPTPQSSAPLQVVTANLRNSGAPDLVNAWRFRREALLAHFRQLTPDVLGVQEALADQQDELVKALPDYAAVGVGRDDGKRAGEFASLFIRSGRLNVVDSGNFWLSPTPEVAGSVGWDAALTRICSWALVRDGASGRELLLANTHFDHVGETAREESAKLIATRLPKLYPGRAMILTGDFNTDDASSAYRAILAAGLVDAYREVHPQREKNEASFHGFLGTTEGRRIDFIFHTPDLVATEAEIDRTKRGPESGKLFLSDHWFIRATLAWKAPWPPPPPPPRTTSPASSP